MGEGQESKAISALRDASKSGSWLILKNLHLVTSWLPLFCQHLQTLDSNPCFRLWLVTEPHTLFSPVLAQQSLKIAYEAPEGIKYNLLRIYGTWGESYIKKLNPTSSRIFFVIACVHAILQERRTFIPQGWLKWYEFSDVDFTSAVKLAEDLWMKQNTQIQWKFLVGLLYSAIYGGRIENVEDLKILKAYSEEYFIDEVLSHRWKPLNLQTSLPSTNNYQEYVTCISQLLNEDVPSYFKLPQNINRSWEKNASAAVISDLKGLDLSKTVPKYFSRKIWHRQLSPFLALWKKLNHGQEFIKIEIPVVSSGESPILSFLSEEFRRAVILIQLIHKNFAVVSKIIKGAVVPVESDILLGNYLLLHQTPKAWLKMWQGPKDPSKYMGNIMDKAINLAKLKRNENYLLKSSIYLSHFLNPDAFLVSYKLEFSKQHKVPMDDLVLQTSWKASGNKANGITLTGLLVEGALFDGFTLTSCDAKSENINAAPDCHITWTERKNVIKDGSFYEAPLYFTTSREKHLTVLQVPCSLKDVDRWILSGLAFLLDY